MMSLVYIILWCGSRFAITNRLCSTVMKDEIVHSLYTVHTHIMHTRHPIISVSQLPKRTHINKLKGQAFNRAD